MGGKKKYCKKAGTEGEGGKQGKLKTVISSGETGLIFYLKNGEKSYLAHDCFASYLKHHT
jgi:hypothetical protein